MADVELDMENELEVLVSGLKEIEDEIRQVRQYHESRLRVLVQRRILKDAVKLEGF